MGIVQKTVCVGCLSILLFSSCATRKPTITIPEVIEIVGIVETGKQIRTNDNLTEEQKIAMIDDLIDRVAALVREAIHRKAEDQ